MESQKFEESFKEAFNEAEVTPSDSVWTNVELDLEKSSGGEMKRKLLFFQLLAAASMVFAMGTGAVYYLNTKPSGDQLLTNQASSIQSSNAGNNTTGQKSADVQSNDARNGSVKANQPSATENSNSEIDFLSSNQKLQKDGTNGNNALVSVHDPSNNNKEHDNQYASQYSGYNKSRSIGEQKPSSQLVYFEQPKIIIPVSEADPGMVLLARLQDEEKKFNKDEKPKMKERSWASIGVGAGSFNPQASSSTPPPAQKSFGFAAGTTPGATTSSSSPSSGTSYSVGVSMAGKISRRVVLQGGLSYLSQNAEFTSSSAVGQNASLNEVAVKSDALVPTSPYKVNSNLQYLSVPMQAGYLVLDRGFGIQLNGGLSTDLFLQNTLTPEDKSLDKVSQGAGSDSPYRTINFSGLVGTEFSYKVADHYRIAVSPGLRYALNSIYKSEIDSQMSPMTFDVSVRFRYIIK